MPNKNDKNKSDQVQIVSVEQLVPKDHVALMKLIILQSSLT